MIVLAIDPGSEFSAYCLIDTDDYFCIECGKVHNYVLRSIIRNRIEFDRAVIEGMSSYGAAVGSEVFRTCYEIGAYSAIISDKTGDYISAFIKSNIIKRRDVKNMLGLPSNTTDSGVRNYLVERFADGAPNYGKGRKGSPGWFYGFSADIWQAYALGVAYIDKNDFEHVNRNRFNHE